MLEEDEIALLTRELERARLNGGKVDLGKTEEEEIKDHYERGRHVDDEYWRLVEEHEREKSLQKEGALSCVIVYDSDNNVTLKKQLPFCADRSDSKVRRTDTGFSCELTGVGSGRGDQQGQQQLGFVGKERQHTTRNSIDISAKSPISTGELRKGLEALAESRGERWNGEPLRKAFPILKRKYEESGVHIQEAKST